MNYILNKQLAITFKSVKFSPHTCTDGSDYSKFARIEFTLTTRIIDAPVPLIDDDIFELTEQFGASLTFPEVPPSRVTLASDPAQVTILDDDGQ